MSGELRRRVRQAMGSVAVASMLMMVAPGLAAAAVGEGSISDVSCPSTTQCTAGVVSASNGVAEVVTFDPEAPVATAPFAFTTATNQTLSFVSCATVARCVELGSRTGTSDAIGFDPADPSAYTSLLLDGAAISNSCPTVDECVSTSVDDHINAMPIFSTTYDPIDATPSSRDVSRGAGDAVCPTATECVATRSISSGVSRAVTFDPTVDSGMTEIDGVTDSGVCASASVCVGDDGTTGQVAVYDPQQPSAAPRYDMVDPGHHFAVASCPSQTECVGIDDANAVVTLDPSGAAVPTRTVLSTTPWASDWPIGLACPSTTECVTIDEGQGELTFDPRNLSGATVKPILAAPATPVPGAPAPPATGSLPPTQTQPGTPRRPRGVAIRRALRSLIDPHPGIAVPALIRHGDRFAFKAPTAGRLTVRWTMTDTTRHRRRTLTIATFSTRIVRSGRIRETIRLTMVGRRRLRALRTVTLTVRVSFRARGGQAVSVGGTIHLRR